MNELLIKDNFESEILFKIYSEVVRRCEIPNLELILDLYDDRVKDRLSLFQYDVKPYELGAHSSLLIRNLRTYPESLLRQLSTEIGMKVILEKEEIKGVFNYFHTFYKDDFDEYYNLPIQEVW